LSVWWLAVPLVLLEAHALLGLLLHAAGLWNLHSVTPPVHVEGTDLRLAVLVPTYDEPPEVLLPTIAAAVAVRLPHQTWVLDDGNRPEVATLAASSARITWLLPIGSTPRPGTSTTACSTSPPTSSQCWTPTTSRTRTCSSGRWPLR
jgi:cellulose synthase/poly-beta-1,6-N-acetylglucosamine synthase-like glycosyltransferase